jgi:hypothetical protein
LALCTDGIAGKSTDGRTLYDREKCGNSFDCLLERSDKTEAGFKQQSDGKTKLINFRMLKITERNKS